MRFCCLATVGMVIVGILPGALSPEPHFRRLIILAIGIDILKGAGIYGIGGFVVRFLPRMVAVPAIMAALVPYALSEWNTFFYKAFVTESSSKNSPVAIVHEITSLLAQDKKAVLLVPNQPNLLNREEMQPILAFEFGYPPELPSSLTILPLTDVRAPITDAIIPIDSYVRLKRGELQLGSGSGSGLQLSNERMKENRVGQTHVIVDVVVGSPAMAGGNPST